MHKKIKISAQEPNDDVLHEKLADAMIPGALIEFDPLEAEQVGAFTEDALSEQDAMDSTIDVQNME